MFSTMINGIKQKQYDLKKDYKNITVHLVSHSHLDPGWLETFEDYYERDVRNILTNIIERLVADDKKDLHGAKPAI